MDTLPIRLATVVEMRTGLASDTPGEPITQAEVEKNFGMSQAGISQLELKAYKLLRHPTRTQPLAGLLDIGNTKMIE